MLEIKSNFSIFINLEVFPVCGMEPVNFSSLRNGVWKLFQFTEWKLDFFRVTEWNPEIFPVYGIKTWTFQERSGIQTQGSGNFRFPFRKLEKFRVTWRKPGKYRFPIHPEMSRNSTLRNKFPDHSIYKTEFLSPIHKISVLNFCLQFLKSLYWILSPVLIISVSSS